METSTADWNYYLWCYLILRDCLDTYLHILDRCKEYQHTEKSRSIQEVQEAHGLQHSLHVQGDHVVQQSL